MGGNGLLDFLLFSASDGTDGAVLVVNASTGIDIVCW